MPQLVPNPVGFAFDDVVETTSKNATIGTVTRSIPAGAALVVAYAQGVTTARDTLSFGDNRGNVYATTPDGWISNNLQIFAGVSLLTTTLQVGDTVVATLPAGTTRNRRLLSAHGWTNVGVPTMASLVAAERVKAAQGLSTTAAPTVPGVVLPGIPLGHLLVGVLATTLGGGSITWQADFPAAAARTSATATGAGDKRLSSSWRIVSGSAGDKVVAAAQSVPSPSPWGLVGIALPPLETTQEPGRILQRRGNQWIPTGAAGT